MTAHLLYKSIRRPFSGTDSYSRGPYQTQQKAAPDQVFTVWLQHGPFDESGILYTA